MKKRITNILISRPLGALLVFLSIGWSAESKATEVFAGFGSLDFTGETALEANLGYSHSLLFDWLELTAGASYNTQSFGDVSVSSIMLTLGPTFALSEPPATVFLSLGGAFRTYSSDPESNTSSSSSSSSSSDESSEDPEGIGFYFIVGKHFELGPLFYRPNLGVVWVGKLSVVANPIQLSMPF